MMITTLRHAVAVALVACTVTAGCAPAIAPPTFPVGPPYDVVVATSELAGFLRAHARRVTVERVLDGDTIVVTGDERIRLLTIGTSQCGAQAAADTLSALLPPSTPVLLSGFKGVPDKDREGRTLANVYLDRADGLINVSLYLIENGMVGLAGPFWTPDSDAGVVLEDAARTARRGTWAVCTGSP